MTRFGGSIVVTNPVLRAPSRLHLGLIIFIPGKRAVWYGDRGDQHPGTEALMQRFLFGWTLSNHWPTYFVSRVKAYWIHIMRHFTNVSSYFGQWIVGSYKPPMLAVSWDRRLSFFWVWLTLVTDHLHHSFKGMPPKRVVQDALEMAEENGTWNRYPSFVSDW